MRGYIVQLKGFGQEPQYLLETVGQGQKMQSRGWTVYASREDADKMKEWAEREMNSEDVIEVIEITLGTDKELIEILDRKFIQPFEHEGSTGIDIEYIADTIKRYSNSEDWPKRWEEK